MHRRFTQTMAAIMACALLALFPLRAPAVALAPGQLDQMLAPIALYPDALLAQILMAATYPLDIVQADRWLQNPNNAALSGNQLALVLEQQPWDPSVKALLPFPQVLGMLDANLDWTEQLGETFLAAQAAVMQSIQRLRQNAYNAGRLQSSAQEVVTLDGPVISIEPANQDTVYVPVYDPDTAYGTWAYPDFPPDDVSGFYNGGFGWIAVAIIAPLWGWDHMDWERHRIDIDANRYNRINRLQRSPVAAGAWHHDPVHRDGVPYRDAGNRASFQSAPAAAEIRDGYRGYPQVPPQQPTRSVVASPGMRAQTSHAPAPAYESFEQGGNARAQSERGSASRQSMPAAHVSEPAAAPRPPAARGGNNRERR